MTRLMHVTTVPETATSFLAGQLKYLGQNGFRVSLVTSPTMDLGDFIERECISYFPVAMRRAISPLHDAQSLRRLIDVMREIDPTIVHAHTPKAGLLAMLAARICRVPIRIYHLHGLRYESACGWRRRLLFAAERTACAAATARICVSRSLRSAAIRDGLICADQAAVLANGSANGLNSKRFDSLQSPTWRADVRGRLGIPSTARVLGFVGRMVRDKGIVELASAWQQLREEFDDLQLLLVGPFEDGDSVPEDTKAILRADPRVHLAGVDWNSAPYYAAMDVFALPTHREGLGVVLLEAAAMELPTIACRVTGCIDAVEDGHTGTLVARGDVNELVAAARRYLLSPDLRQMHGVAGRRRVIRQFRPESIWQSLASFYRQLERTEHEPSTMPRGFWRRQHLPS